MPKYDVLIAQSVQCYATVEIEAESIEHAARLLAEDRDLGQYGYWDRCHPEWDSSDDYRIVSVDDPETGEFLAEDVPLPANT